MKQITEEVAQELFEAGQAIRLTCNADPKGLVWDADEVVPNFATLKRLYLFDTNVKFFIEPVCSGISESLIKGYVK